MMIEIYDIYVYMNIYVDIFWNGFDQGANPCPGPLLNYIDAIIVQTLTKVNIHLYVQISIYLHLKFKTNYLLYLKYKKRNKGNIFFLCFDLECHHRVNWRRVWPQLLHLLLSDHFFGINRNLLSFSRLPEYFNQILQLGLLNLLKDYPQPLIYIYMTINNSLKSPFYMKDMSSKNNYISCVSLCQSSL